MKTIGLHLLFTVLAALVLTTGARAATSTSATSDAQQINDVAIAVLDASRHFDPEALDAVILHSDLERSFASEMLKAMRDEVAMFHRAAVAVSGSEDSEAVKQMDRAGATTGAAFAEAEVAVSGDTATMPFAPAGGRGTTLAFRKVDGRWRIDLLRRYRERGDITEAGVAKWNARQQAAAETTEIYEQKQERDLSAPPLVYETIAKLRAETATKRPGQPRASPPKK